MDVQGFPAPNCLIEEGLEEPPMTETPTDELRLLAARIATAYIQANPQAPDQLTSVIRLAYHSLQRCIAPSPPAAPERKRRHRRSRAHTA